MTVWEQRLLRMRSIFSLVMPPLVIVMAVYVVFTRDSGLIVWPWMLVAVACVPLLGLAEMWGKNVWPARGQPEDFNYLAFTLACVLAPPLIILSGGPKSILWIFLLVPILGASGSITTLPAFLGSRLVLLLVLLAAWLPFWGELGLNEWLEFLIMNGALNVVGMVAWVQVNRERHSRIALAAAEAELRDVNQHLEERVAKQVEQIESARQLQRYVSPQLAEAIMAGRTIELTTTRKEATVFFSDIRGFTALSEQLEPEELIQMMNEYLSAMTEIVFRFDGTLDKYIGDAIMVFFNDPTEQPDHALRCVRMALAMRARLAELQASWFAHGSEPLSIGIGINTGYVTVGNIGSASRMEYTMLGNNVNLASRLCSAAERGQILISHKTQGLVAGHLETRLLREEMVKGKARPVKLYEVLGEAAAVPAAAYEWPVSVRLA